MQFEGSVNFPVARRSHKKSKTGCRTCRIRKVKCDETRPLCLNCERHFIGLKACDFDDNPVLLANNAKSNLVGREAEPLKSVTSGTAAHLFAQNRPPSELSASLIDSLVKHYLNKFAYRSFPFYANKTLVELWWYFVCSDQVLFHVVMLLSSIDKGQSNRTSNRDETTQLYDQSLALLRIRLEDSIAAVSDATIVAVALLAAMEHDRENMRALGIHLNALKRAVEVRGGLVAIKASNILAANMVFWCALVSLDEPMLFSLAFEDEPTNTAKIQLIGETMLTTHDGKETDLLALGLDHRTANCLYEVQRLSKHYTSSLTYDNVDEAMEVLSQLCLVLQSLITLSKLSVDEAAVPGLSQSCRLAGCMHVFAPMSAYFPNPTLMLHSFVREIKTSLTRMINAVGSQSNLLLWLLAVAGITAHSMPERKWFVGHLVVTISELQINTWEEFRSHLVKLAFHDNFCDVSFQSLWEEVRKKEDALGFVVD